MNTLGDCRWAARLVAAILVTLAAAKTSSAQQNFKSMSLDVTDGANPWAGLVQGLDGSLYGAASSGGNDYHGTVFKITPSGTLLTVYDFCSQSGCTDGFEPFDTLVQATDGNLYGTTFSGGAYGYGTVFRLTTSGTLTTLYSFCAGGYPPCADGDDPWGGLVQATDGNFYGTTQDGGTGTVGGGTVFKITPAGELTTLYSFCARANCADGETPRASLVQGVDGNLYGTTQLGGLGGDGTVFKITPAGILTTLHSFHGLDGAGLDGGLVQALDGNLYGVTGGGGATGFGTVFKITPSGTLTTLYGFCDPKSCGDGAYPEASLIQGTDGDFYGTTYAGGDNDSCHSEGGCGTVFEITPTGTLTTLHNFDLKDGAEVAGSIVQATNGGFYGTTFGGGESGGTVFELNTGLSPFVKTLPTSGEVGAVVTILGTDLTGSTSVSFNGTPATLKQVTRTAIETSVPSGATTGPVQVVTSSGTLSTNVPFQVIP